MRKFVGLVVMLALVAGTANAETLYSGTNFDVVRTTPVSVGTAENLVSFTLSIVGKNGKLPSTFDSTNDGAQDANQGGIIAAKMHQEYQTSGMGSPKISPTSEFWSDNGVTPPDWDSYFLIAESDDWSPITAPGETVNLASSSQSALYAGYNFGCNFGDRLYGAFAKKGTAPSTLDLANICVPSGTALSFDFNVAASDGTTEYIPEPATLTLLGLGGVLGLLRRKRA